jgi:hypothetical protein
MARVDDDVDGGRPVPCGGEERKALGFATAVFRQDERAVVHLRPEVLRERVLLWFGQRGMVVGRVDPPEERSQRFSARAIDLSQGHDVHVGQRNPVR